MATLREAGGHLLVVAHMQRNACHARGRASSVFVDGACRASRRPQGGLVDAAATIRFQATASPQREGRSTASDPAGDAMPMSMSHANEADSGPS